MPYLSRSRIEEIATRVIDAYKVLPALAGRSVEQIKPMVLARDLLGLTVGHYHLSGDRSVLGLTTYCEIGVEVQDDRRGVFFYDLDGRTILVEQDLLEDEARRGRYNFTLMHEIGHQLLGRIFPEVYRVPRYRLLCLRNDEHDWDWNEWRANALASALLMPEDLVRRAMEQAGLGVHLEMVNRVFRPAEYRKFEEMAALLGVSKKALAIRMRRLGLLNSEYLENPYALVDIVMEDEEECPGQSA